MGNKQDKGIKDKTESIRNFTDPEWETLLILKDIDSIAGSMQHEIDLHEEINNEILEVLIKYIRKDEIHSKLYPSLTDNEGVKTFRKIIAKKIKIIEKATGKKWEDLNETEKP